MDQIRFDFLNAQAATALNRNAPAPGEGSDAFSQILDQQLARSRDNAAQQSQDNPQPNADWRRPADNDDRPDTPRPHTADRRHITKTASASTEKAATAKNPAGPVAKSAGDKSADATGAKTGSGRSQAKKDDEKDTAVAGQSSSGTGTTATAAAEEKPNADTDPNGQQHRGEDGDGQSSTPKQDADAPTDADLAALMIPVQTIGTAISVKANAVTGGGAATPAMQAALLVAAGLAASPLNLSGNVQAQPGKPGLKFGAVIPNPTAPQAKAGTDATATGKAGDGKADSTDPSAAFPSAATAPKPQATGNASTKSRGTTTAASPVTAAYAGQNGLAANAAQPTGAGVILPWAAVNPGVGTTESAGLAEVAAVSADPELYGSQYLDADFAGATAGASAKTAAFLAQLKQSVQMPTPHEQIAIHIQKAMQNGSNRLTLNLDPAELGRVEVKLDVDKDKNVTAAIVVDRPATLDLLQRDAKALERALQDAGLQTNDGSLSFSLRDGAGQGGGGNGADGQAGIGGGNVGAPASETAGQPARTDVIATADGYVDLET